MKRIFLTLVLGAVAADPCWSHGGTYRGPTVPTAPGGRGGGGRGPGGPGGPTSPGPTGPGAAPATPVTPGPKLPLLPTTGGKDELPDPARWEIWWSYNQDAYLDLRGRLQALAASSGENAVAAARRALQEALAPALLALLEPGDKDVVLRQSLIALARLTKVEELGVSLERFAQNYLVLDNSNLQEAVLLALGVRGSPEARELLRHVLMDDEQGRSLVKSAGTTPVRLRAYAAYALGLLGRREPSEDGRRQIVHALLYALGQEGVVEREVRVASALAIGLVPILPCATAEEALDPSRQLEELHLCGGVQLDYLLAIARDEGLDPWFRGHAAASLGRLAAGAGPGFPATEDHPAIRSRSEIVRALVELLRGTTGSPPVQQGCTLALGAAVDADGDEVDEDARELLLEGMKRDEPMAQRFALVSLAAALGRPGGGAEPDAAWKGGSAVLLRELARTKGDRLPWTGLALAVAGHGRAAHQATPPQGFVEALRLRLAGAKDGEEAAAYALGIAVLRSEDPLIHAALSKAFDKRPHPDFRGYGALALGFLGVHAAQAQLEAALDAPQATLVEVIAASLGLRLLGDSDVVPDLVRRLADLEKEKLDEALAIVQALAFLQDPAAGKPLLELLADKERADDLRAAIAWCLGVLADPDSPDWTASYANGLDYNFMPRTLWSPLGDGRGLLDWRY